MMMQQQMQQNNRGGPVVINNQQQMMGGVQPVVMRQAVTENYCGPWSWFIAIFFWPIVCCPVDQRTVYY